MLYIIIKSCNSIILQYLHAFYFHVNWQITTVFILFFQYLTVSPVMYLGYHSDFSCCQHNKCDSRGCDKYYVRVKQRLLRIVFYFLLLKDWVGTWRQ